MNSTPDMTFTGMLFVDVSVASMEGDPTSNANEIDHSKVDDGQPLLQFTLCLPVDFSLPIRTALSLIIWIVLEEKKKLFKSFKITV